MKQVFSDITNQFEEKVGKYNWEDPAHLAVWSAQTFYYTSHGTRIMSLCAARVPVDNDKLHQFFVNHLREEMNHQLLALSDIKKLGFSIDQIPEFSSTRMFYETQYYKALHNPVSFYGFGLMLELLSISVGKTVYNRVKKANLESSFLKVHVHEDESHAPAVEKILETVSEKDAKEVVNNLIQSAYAYELILQESTEFANEKLRRSLKKAA